MFRDIGFTVEKMLIRNMCSESADRVIFKQNPQLLGNHARFY